MSTEYQITKRGYLKNYTPYYINVEANDKEFMDYIDKKLNELLQDYGANP